MKVSLLSGSPLPHSATRRSSMPLLPSAGPGEPGLCIGTANSKCSTTLYEGLLWDETLGGEECGVLKGLVFLSASMFWHSIFFKSISGLFKTWRGVAFQVCTCALKPPWSTGLFWVAVFDTLIPGQVHHEALFCLFRATDSPHSWQWTWVRSTQAAYDEATPAEWLHFTGTFLCPSSS